MQPAVLQQHNGDSSTRGRLAKYMVCAFNVTCIMTLVRPKEEEIYAADRTMRACTVTMACRMPGPGKEGAMPFKQLPHTMQLRSHGGSRPGPRTRTCTSSLKTAPSTFKRSRLRSASTLEPERLLFKPAPSTTLSTETCHMPRQTRIYGLTSARTLS